MIYVSVKGGLGNQLYQYSFYKSLELRGLPTKLSLQHLNVILETKISNCSAHNGYELEHIFNLSLNYAVDNEISDYYYKNSIFDLLLRNFHSFRGKYILEKGIKYNANILSKAKHNNILYLDGYWCSYKYMDKFYEEITKSLTFKDELRDENLKVSKIIQSCNSVSIHVRRGDYLNFENIYNKLSIDYYNEAIKIALNKYKELKFFIFSDDIQWCKENIKLENSLFIDWNKEDNSYIDMRLMALCKINIIANSTFSQWAGHLNRNIGKLVIAPKKLFVESHSTDTPDYPENWVVI